MSSTLHFLCAGAAQGLVKALEPRLLAETGVAIAGRFGAVGAMKHAVRAGEPCDLMIVTDERVGELVAAGAICFPDPVKATAGIQDQLQPRFRTFPIGATAMREMASSDAPRPIGCTQVTAINYAPGVELVAPLPPRFELATGYSAGVGVRAAEPALAARFIAMLGAADTQGLRAAGGFES